VDPREVHDFPPDPLIFNPQRGWVGLITGGGVIGLVPPPGMKPGDGGGAESAEKLSIDCALVDNLTFPLASIQATLFLLGSVN
jgi:hypothetical protein